MPPDAGKPRTDGQEAPIEYTRPADVPPDLTPLERAVIAARQIRLWADWLLETGPAPPKSEELTEAKGKP